MRIVSVGGGPAGLYFAILAKGAHPDWDIEVHERHRPEDTFGFGVVFSDQTLRNLGDADRTVLDRIEKQFAHWDDIDVFVHGECVRSTGHGFAGLSRQTLLAILSDRAAELGVTLKYGSDVTDVKNIASQCDLLLGADGLNSTVRAAYEDDFGPTIDARPNRFVWLGTTMPFEAFTFYFKENDAGLWRVHAYRYEEGKSTFIVEATEETWRRSGMSEADEDTTVAYLTALFKDELQGHPLIRNRSIWRQFPTVSGRRWHHKNVVLIGDSAHTAHFSIGSGTKLAMEDSIALAEAIEANSDVEQALAAYDKGRRKDVASLQRAAQVSLEWFEETERYMQLDALQFTFSLLTRSLRITHENLRLRDPELVAQVDRRFHAKACEARGDAVSDVPPPPMFEPYQLRGLRLANRVVVSPMCMYSAEEGLVNDFHLVHLGSRAQGGAGLVLTEMTCVSADARITPGCAGLYTDEHSREFKRIVDFIHGSSPAKVGLQLGHAGRKGATKVMWEGMDAHLEDGGWPLLSASAIPWTPTSQTPKAMDAEDMDRVCKDFVQATERGLSCGFDWLELHCAHGYLLASFLSPLTNHREDEYGGSLENRLRYPLRVLKAVRAAWPDDRPLSVRISATDWHEQGITGDEAVAIAKALVVAGADVIDVSTGQTDPKSRPRFGRLWQTPHAERIRLEAEVPTMTVGGISSYADVNGILAAGRADLCMIARGHLYDPYWTRHAAAALGYELPWPKQYSVLSNYTFRFE